MLRTAIEVGVPDLTHIEWGDVEGIEKHARSFFPYLERFVWGIASLRSPYVIEGADFLPTQAMQLAEAYRLRAAFLGNSGMTGRLLRTHLGRQPWLAGTTDEMFERMADHVVGHTALVERECSRLGVPFFDLAGDFDRLLLDAAARLQYG